MKRKICLALVVIVFFTSIFFQNSILSAINKVNISKYTYDCTLGDIEGITYSELKSVYGLPSYVPKSIEKNGTLLLNEELWLDKGIAVYGDYTTIRSADATRNDRKVKANGYYNGYEYRYHGYSREGNLFTNEQFPNDTTSTPPFAERTFIYKWWKEKGQEESDFNDRAIRGDEYWRNLINHSINDRIVKSTNKSADKNFDGGFYNTYEHGLILSMATTLFNGSIRLYRRASNGDFYQTFSTNTLVNKKTVPFTLDIEILNKGKIEAKGQTLVDLSIKYMAILQDGAYINHATDKYKYYTREDIKFYSEKLILSNGGSLNTSISMKESTTIGGNYAFTGTVKTKVKASELAKGITVNGTASLEYNGGGGASAIDSVSIIVEALPEPEKEKLLGVNCKYNVDNVLLKATDTFTLDKVNYIDLSIGDVTRYSFEVDGKRLSQYGEPGNSVIETFIYNSIKDKVNALSSGQTLVFHTKQIIYDEGNNKSEYSRSFFVNKQREAVKPKQVIEASISIPDKAFDIVPYSASYSVKAGNGGEAPTIKEKYVTIDGNPVDFDYFFSGGYVFGESDLNRPMFVRAVMVSDDDIETYVEQWVTVYTTKPKAQLKFEGQTKVNRKVVIKNESEINNLNNPYLLSNYPNSYTYEFIGDDTVTKIKSISDLEKHLLYKKEGFYQVKVTASNYIHDADGGARVRTSESYILSYYVLPDYTPNVIFNIWNNVLVRGEKLDFVLDVQSLDGDELSKHEVTILFDNDQDGTYETQIAKMDYADINNRSWVFYRLGNYRVISYAEERFDDTTTIPEFLDSTEKVTVTTVRDFFVDNLRPIVNIDVDLPVNLQSVDVFVMGNENIDRSLDTELKTEKVNYANSIRLYGVDALVNYWDLHTYVHTQDVSISNSTGGSYPSSTYGYNSGGYTGTLNRTSVTNNPYQVNNGYYTTEKQCKTVTKYKTVCDGNVCPRTWYAWCCSVPDGTKEVCESVSVWKDSYSTYDSYTGYYGGTVSKPVKQSYSNPFRQNSDKYVIFVGDSNPVTLTDYNMIKTQAGFKTILIGKASDQSKFNGLDYFVDIGSNTLAQAMSKAVKHIGSRYTLASEYLMLKGTPFTISELLFDTEGDIINNIGYQYVQENVFDNPEPRESFSRTSFTSNTSDFSSYKANTFNSVGKHTIFRLAKDDTTQGEGFNLESNLASVSILVHRKPVALCTLDWDYNPATNRYITRWVDQSYDLDHNISRADKGIVDRQIMFRQDSGAWMYYIPSELDPGHSYTLQYTVKDVEGVWSDPYTMSFILNLAPPIQFEAKAKTELDIFSMMGVPASENILAYDIWTRYPYEHFIKWGICKREQNSESISLKNKWTTNAFDKIGDCKVANDWFWKDMLVNISDTLIDGEYKLYLRAENIKNSEQYRELAFDFTVNTPINLLPYELKELQGANMNTLSAETSKYASKVNAILFKDTEFECTYEMNCIELVDVGVGKKVWEISMEISSDIPEGVYDIEYIAETPNGNIERVLQQTMVRQIGLENLRIIKVFDPTWRDVGIIPVDKMPIYENANKPIKLGYAVQFKIDSINLENETDQIIIKYSYYLNDKGVLTPVDIYVMNEQRKYTNISVSEYADNACVNTLKRGKANVEVKALDEGRSEWSFKMFLPYHSKFIRKGNKLDLWNDNTLKGELLVCAEITGVQNKVEGEDTVASTVTYNAREEKWAFESKADVNSIVSKPSGQNLLGYGVNNGELFWYNLSSTAFDDLLFQREW